MQSDKILIELKELAERIGIKVTEQVLKSPGIHVRSGLCRVQGKDRFILDKKLNLKDKIELLADCLCLQDISGVFLIPQVRDLLAKHKKRAEASDDASAQDRENGDDWDDEPSKPQEDGEEESQESSEESTDGESTGDSVPDPEKGSQDSEEIDGAEIVA